MYRVVLKILIIIDVRFSVAQQLASTELATGSLTIIRFH